MTDVVGEQFLVAGLATDREFAPKLSKLLRLWSPDSSRLASTLQIEANGTASPISPIPVRL